MTEHFEELKCICHLSYHCISLSMSCWSLPISSICTLDLSGDSWPHVGPSGVLPSPVKHLFVLYEDWGMLLHNPLVVLPRGALPKIYDGYVRPHWPPFSNRLSLNDPLFIFHILLSPNDPHFQNALSLNDPLFLEIFIGENGRHALTHFHQ